MNKKPEVGQWFWDNGRECLFEVVALDDEGVEVQFFDGDLSLFEWPEWIRLSLVAVPPPEDWSGPFDDLEPEDLPREQTAPPCPADPLLVALERDQ